MMIGLARRSAPFGRCSDDEPSRATGERLRKVADFKYVSELLPMKNKMQAVVYYLFLASPKAVDADIIESIFAKYR